MIKKVNLFFASLDGILRTPGQTLGSLMSSKKWVPYLVFIMITVLILSFATFPYMADQMSEVMKDSKFADYFEGQSFDFQNLSFAQKIFVLLPEQISLFVIIGVGAFFTYLFFGIGGAEGQYVNYFSVVVGASLIDVVFPKMVETVSLIFNVKFAGLLSPVFLIPGANHKSFLSILVSRFDVFSIWYTVAIALGIAYFSKLSKRKSMYISFSYLVFKAFVISAFSFFFISVI